MMSQRPMHASMWYIMLLYLIWMRMIKTVDMYTVHTHKLPKLIHQTWKTLNVPIVVQRHVNSWKRLNPEYEYRLWTDDEIDVYMIHRHPELTRAWTIMNHIEKADTFRYAILFDQGGIYADVDVTCVKSIKQWSKGIDNVELYIGFEVMTERHDWKDWFARKYQICQWTMGGVPGHPVFKLVLKKIVQFFAEFNSEQRERMGVMESTGPGIWTDAVMEHLRETHNIVFDITSERDINRIKRISESRTRKVYHQIGTILLLPVAAFASTENEYINRRGRDMSEIYIVHHFLGSWKSNYIGH